MATPMLSEESCWLNAAYRVLLQAQRPMHYTDIKRIILELGLMPSGMKTTLEAALCREAQSQKRRVSLVTGHPGVFTITPKSSSQTKLFSGSSGHNKVRSTNGKTSVSSSSFARYMQKYRRMKRLIRDTIFTNAAICDEVVRIEQKIARAKEERRYLFLRVMQRQAVHTNITTETSPRVTASSPSSLPQVPPSSTSSSSSSSRPVAQSIAQLLGEVEKRRKKAASRRKARGGGEVAMPVGAACEMTGIMHAVHSISDTTGMKNRVSGVVSDLKRTLCKDDIHATSPRVVKKPRPGHNNKRRVTPIPLDNSGRPIFPIELGTLVVYCLGETVSLPGYYTVDHIYPVGFCSTRLYLSINQNTGGSVAACLYTCKVSDGGSAAKFEISPEDRPDLTFVGTTPSDCHRQLLHAINSARGSGTVPMDPRGVEFFGLSHPTVQNLIQSCAGARRCTNYQWVKFETSRNEADSFVEENPSVNISLVSSVTVSCASEQVLSSTGFAKRKAVAVQGKTLEN